MNIDENDLLATNKFIKSPELGTELSNDKNEEFKKYYMKEMKKKEQKKIKEKVSLKNIKVNEDEDPNNLLNTNKFDKQISDNTQQFNRYKKEVKTYVNIDSRDRDKILFPKANAFKIFLGKTFYNVKTIRLASIEFPNTSAVINSTNNKIYWRNLEDIQEDRLDNITELYPVYSVDLRIGSYISTTLKTEITNKVKTVKREKGSAQSDYHYFIVDLDLDTDVVTFTSLILTNLAVSPLSVTRNSTTITVQFVDHGYVVGDIIYIVNAQSLAGIPASTINGEHKVTAVIDKDTFQIEVNIKASDQANGGGNTVQAGTLAPFQFLFGENSNSIAQNLGFPLENSSERIDVAFQKLENITMLEIKTILPHNLDVGVIGQLATFNNTNVTLTGGTNLDGTTRVITNIGDSYTIYVQAPAVTTIGTEGNISIDGKTYDISSIMTSNIQIVLVKTYTPHGFDNFSDSSLRAVRKTMFYDTTTVPSLDGEQTVYSILSDTEFLIRSNILQTQDTGGDYSLIGTIGNMPRHEPLSTVYLSITNVTPGSITTITSPNHGLQVGDKIKIYNVPVFINGTIYEVYTVLNSNEFTINLETPVFNMENITNGIAKIGTQIIKLSLPYHGFNSIIHIQKIQKSIIDISGNGPKAIITTASPHLLTTGDYVYIDNTDCSPPIDDTINGYVVTVLSSTTFEITANITTNGTTGDILSTRITTRFNHNLTTGQKIRLSGTLTSTSIDGGYTVTVISDDEFDIGYTGNISLPSPTPDVLGYLGLSTEFYLYGIPSTIGGIKPDNLNNKKFSIREIIDEHSFYFTCNDICNAYEIGGGINVHISSLSHGFRGIQSNLKNSLLNRSINLEGENYAFLCCPQLGTMMNTGNVKNIFARITLDQSPGSMIFAFLSNPKEFDVTPLNMLSELEFSIVNYDGTFYEFNDLDYSFVLEIIEELDVTDSFNMSSRRGTTNDTKLIKSI
jgi:hypothetical protein